MSIEAVDLTPSVEAAEVPVVVQIVPDVTVPTVVTPPSILAPDDPVTGDLLALDLGVWDAVVSSYAVQWLLDGETIPGATDASYTPTTAGSYSATVSASNEAGGSATSLTGSVAVAEAPTDSAPTVVTPPSILPGSPAVGDVVVLDLGLWSSVVDSYDVQWLLDGSPISGATSTSYTTEAEGSLSATVEAANAAGSTAVTTAAVTVGPAPEEPGPFRLDQMAPDVVSDPSGTLASGSDAGSGTVVSGAAQAWSDGAVLFFRPTVDVFGTPWDDDAVWEALGNAIETAGVPDGVGMLAGVAVCNNTPTGPSDVDRWVCVGATASAGAVQPVRLIANGSYGTAGSASPRADVHVIQGGWGVLGRGIRRGSVSVIDADGERLSFVDMVAAIEVGAGQLIYLAVVIWRASALASDADYADIVHRLTIALEPA